MTCKSSRTTSTSIRETQGSRDYSSLPTRIGLSATKQSKCVLAWPLPKRKYCKNVLLGLFGKFSFYFEAMKHLKKKFHDKPDQCPFPEFGQNLSNFPKLA